MLIEEMLDYEPDLFIVYTGHNEFLEQRTYGKMISTPPFLRWLESTVEGTRTFTLVSKVIDPVGNRPESIRNTNSTLDGEVKAVLDDVVGLEAYTRDEELREQISEHFEHSLRRIIEIAESVDTPILLISLASNMRDASPFKSE